MKRCKPYFLLRPLVIVIWFSVFLSSCVKEEIEYVTKRVVLPPFREIDLQAVFDVEFLEADTFSLEITGRKDIVEMVRYPVTGEVLRLDNDFGKLWHSPASNKIKLYISGKGLSKINAAETCSFETINTIHAETILITLGGKLNFARLHVDCQLFYYYNTSPVGGELYVDGTAYDVGIFNGSLMKVDAKDLICQTATVETSSKTDIHVHVMQQLNYSIRGVGNIYLYGNPADIIVGELLSSGRLIPK